MFCALPKKRGTSKISSCIFLVTVPFGKCIVNLSNPMHNSSRDSISASVENLLTELIFRVLNKYEKIQIYARETHLNSSELHCIISDSYLE